MLRYGALRTRRGNEIVYTAIGPGRPEGGAPLLLVHPLNLRKECWLGLVPALALDRPCVAMDLAGHGESSDDEKFSLEGWVSDCLDVVNTLSLDRVHLVGGSLGGAIALCLAGELPERVLSVTAMGSDLGGEPAPGEQPPDLAGMLDSMTTGELFDRLAREAVAPGSPAELVSTVRRLTNTHGEPTVRRILQAAQAADATAWVPRVRCPVLVLNGEFDATATPESGERMATGVGGRHETLRGVGHLPMLEAAATVLRMVQPHLDAAEARAKRQ